MKPVSVIADHLVEKSPITEKLMSRGADIAFDRLNVGDYRVSSRCTVVVLPADEFSRLTSDRKLFRRVAEFKKSVPDPVIIVQGTQSTNGNGPSRAAIRGALAFLAVHNRVPVLFADGESDAADIIYAMGNQVQNGMGESPNDTPAKPSVSAIDVRPDGNGNGNGNGQNSAVKLADLPEQILCLLPDVNPATASAMLERFGSLRGVFAASSRDLNTVRGIGPKKAKRLATFLDRSHKRPA